VFFSSAFPQEKGRNARTFLPTVVPFLKKKKNFSRGGACLARNGGDELYGSAMAITPAAEEAMPAYAKLPQPHRCRRIRAGDVDTPQSPLPRAVVAAFGVDTNLLGFLAATLQRHRAPRPSATQRGAQRSPAATQHPPFSSTAAQGATTFGSP